MKNRILSLSFALLSIFSLAGTATAQNLASPVGMYEMVDVNNHPITEGVFWGVNVFELGPGVYYDIVYRIKDGVFEIIDDECAVYTINDAGDGYDFTTGKGNTGTLTEEDDGRWKSTMTSGDHSGTSVYFN